MRPLFVFLWLYIYGGGGGVEGGVRFMWPKYVALLEEKKNNNKQRPHNKYMLNCTVIPRVSLESIMPHLQIFFPYGYWSGQASSQRECL